MNRRHVLALLGSTFPLTGCSSPEAGTSDDTDADEPTTEATRSNATRDHAEDIFIVLHNQTSEQVTVAITITTNDSVLFEDEVTVNLDGIQHVYPEITDRGDYELTVSLPNRPDQTRPFNIEEYDLRMGSNIDIWISEDEVRIGIEE